MTTQHEAMDRKNLKKVIKVAQNTVDLAIDKVCVEDELEPEPDEAAFLPVKNVLLYEKVRAEKKLLKQQIAEKDWAIAEKEKLIVEQNRVQLKKKE